MIIGYDTRNIVCSANKSGYNVYSIDAFCDFDLKESAVSAKKIPSNYVEDIKSISCKKIVEWISEFEIDFDAIVLDSGFEYINQEQLPSKVLNNSQEIMNEVTDKYRFARKLESMDIPHPVTYAANDIKNIDDYPIIVKPKRAGGGMFNRKAESFDELESVIDELLETYPLWTLDDLIIQKFEKGIPASVSIVSTGDNAYAIAINEQLIGEPWLTDTEFAYCGNITPFETLYQDEMYKISKQLMLEFGLKGSNGVDFIITEDGPIVLEINPRLQGSLDTVELATDMNLFDTHVKSFSGILPETTDVKQFAARAVVYSQNDVLINKQILNGLIGQNTVDIPDVGHHIGIYEPLTSVVHKGHSRRDVMEKLRISVEKIRCLTDGKGKEENKTIPNLNTKLKS